MEILVTLDRERTVKPNCSDRPATCPANGVVPLGIFDVIGYDTNFAVVYAFRAPAVSNDVVIRALSDVLVEYREWAGRMGIDARSGRRAILLNDKGVRVVEATSAMTLDRAFSKWPSPDLKDLHPAGEGKELLQVQLTRFTCGGLTLGLTCSHMVSDGSATSGFFVSWGRVARGMGPLVRPTHHRDVLFPRDPPRVEFEHYGWEYLPPQAARCTRSDTVVEPTYHPKDENVVVHRARFSAEFIEALRAEASTRGGGTAPGKGRPYSRFEVLVAHLWRAVTRVRRLDDGVVTRVRISVDGRTRLKPGPSDALPLDRAAYWGNLVLWAFPEATAGELLRGTLSHAAGLIREAVAKVDDRYFRSFVDFTATAAAQGNGDLVQSAEMQNWVMSPNLEVDSWLRCPFYNIDFGGGAPFVFTPTWLPYEGYLALLPMQTMDGSVHVLVALHKHNVPSFLDICYDLHC